MALTRKFLASMGLEADKIDTIIDAHLETVDGLKEKAKQYEEKANQLDSVQEELQNVKAENETLKSGDDWKAKYDKLNGDFDKYKNDIAEKELTAQKTEAYKALLKEAGVSDKAISLIMQKSDLLKDIELEDGKIKDADTLAESFKTEYADFIAQTKTQGSAVTTPPTNDGAKSYTYADIAKMSRDEINANWSDISKSLANNKGD